MESILKVFDPTLNFWEASPEFLTIKEFEKLYDSDKSKKKKDSSTLMWAVAIMIDPHDGNPLRNISWDDRLDIVREDYSKGVSTEQGKYYLKLYETLCLTPFDRTIINLKGKLEEREAFLNGTKYNIENAKELDSLIANTKKLKELYDLLVEEMQSEKKGAGQTKGGRIESASEKGEL